MMKKIEAIIRPAKVNDVYVALAEAGCPGLTISEIEGQGKQKGVEQEFRGKKYRTSLMTKAKIEIIANDEDVEKLVEAICSSALTEKAGDGKIFVFPIDDAIRIRTKERGKAAI
jgi:nitrogen regulatory protein P-II 1